MRMPEGLRDRIKLAADAADKSMNLLIVETLEAAFPDEKEQLRAALRLLDAKIAELPPERQAPLLEFRKQLWVDLWYEPLPREEDDDQ
nr:Arc family DNA-binding protein [Aureimonas phyllosphaerae]